MDNAKPHWSWRGIAALVGSPEGTFAAGTLREFYDRLWTLFYTRTRIEPPKQVDEPAEKCIWVIHDLGRRAREMDEDALAKLVMINAAASLQLQGVAIRAPDYLRKFTERCNAWLGPVSDVPSIQGAMAETLGNLGLGGGPQEQRRRRTDLRSQPTGFAFLLLSYMTLIRFGFLTNRNEDWESRCRELPTLSADTVGKWWDVGRLELERSFPNIEEILSRGRAHGNELPKDRALQRVEQAFRKLWKWFAFVSVFRLAGTLLKRFKKNAGK